MRMDDEPGREFIRLSPEDFAALGIDQVAYVRERPAGEGLRFEIHAADGDTVAEAETRDLAYAAVLRHGLVPVSLH
ncbi:MAG: hypothetical protein FJX21_21160 [Alphaproteobacteria bacterium]|nr:hypothetical protein [Alphaproteobacteria bacterium]